VAARVYAMMHYAMMHDAMMVAAVMAVVAIVVAVDTDDTYELVYKSINLPQIYRNIP
jgi:hypothetical protein